MTCRIAYFLINQTSFPIQVSCGEQDPANKPDKSSHDKFRVRTHPTVYQEEASEVVAPMAFFDAENLFHTPYAFSNLCTDRSLPILIREIELVRFDTKKIKHIENLDIMGTDAQIKLTFSIKRQKNILGNHAFTVSGFTGKDRDYSFRPFLAYAENKAERRKYKIVPDDFKVDESSDNSTVCKVTQKTRFVKEYLEEASFVSDKVFSVLKNCDYVIPIAIQDNKMEDIFKKEIPKLLNSSTIYYTQKECPDFSKKFSREKKLFLYLLIEVSSESRKVLNVLDQNEANTGPLFTSGCPEINFNKDINNNEFPFKSMLELVLRVDEYILNILNRAKYFKYYFSRFDTKEVVIRAAHEVHLKWVSSR